MSRWCGARGEVLIKPRATPAERALSIHSNIAWSQVFAFKYAVNVNANPSLVYFKFRCSIIIGHLLSSVVSALLGFAVSQMVEGVFIRGNHNLLFP